MTSAYHKFPCEICGRDISDAGFARASHMKAHARKGLYTNREFYDLGWRTALEIIDAAHDEALLENDARDGLLGWQIDYEPTDADLRDRAADWKMDDDRMARD